VTSAPQERSGGRTLRTRILATAWVPSVALLLIGGAITTYLGVQSVHIKQVGNAVSGATAAGPFIPSIESELRLSAQAIADPNWSTSALTKQRSISDQLLAASGRAQAKVALDDYTTPADLATQKELADAFRALPAERAGIDMGTISLTEAVAYYGNVIRLIGQSNGLFAATAPNGEAALAASIADQFFRLSGQMAQGNALAYAAFTGPGMTEAQYQSFVQTGGNYRQSFQQLSRMLSPENQQRAKDLMASDAWRQQGLIEKAVLGAKVQNNNSSADGVGAGDDATPPAPTRTAKLPITRDSWAAASEEVYRQMGGIAVDESLYGAKLTSGVANHRIYQAVVIGFALLAFALLVLALTTRESNHLIRRLRRLERETLDLAQHGLPDMVARLGRGEKVDPTGELLPLQFGRDEIGEVAHAFNEAQQVAVVAAIREAETRAGLRAVFLNIARRSQVIVHRQLGVLEQAERFQEDPEQLKLLFELDHLATRARRNAENLVILGGGQPGRRWRNSVDLLQVVRGAISESEDYARVTVADLPPVAINGSGVADVIHVLAEIVDNATSFSPPMSRVEVRGNLVGRGLVLEIEDQGLGIPSEQLDELNEMMQDPPDFHVMALREEPRLGMFVVAQLARSQGIRVTLTPSPAYGGTRVVVLLPSELIDASARTLVNTGERSVLTEGPAKITPGVHSIHERMAFEGGLFADNTGTGPADGAGQNGGVQRDPNLAPAARRAPNLSIAPTGRLIDPPDSPPFASDAATPPAGTPAGGRPGRPELPRRTRQSHLSDRLRVSAPSGPIPLDSTEPPAIDPDEARNRMAAFQRGTRRGRRETDDAQ
jgi:signal transduction histidine kinase